MILRPLAPELVERVWGSTDLSPWFDSGGRKIGEVWFRAGADSPLLIKFIYTTEQLSVQVHPQDEFARIHENSCGKTEMWHVLRAEPGARLGVGLRATVTPDQLREAISSGTIESLMNWIIVRPGDTVFVESGQIHAIGAGVTVCEIQQNSDVTYRLYDYGRPRELHLEKGLAVASLEPYDGRCDLPVRCGCFMTEKLEWNGSFDYSADLPEHFLVFLEGQGTIGNERFRAGQVWYTERGSGQVRITPDESVRVLRTHSPQ